MRSLLLTAALVAVPAVLSGQSRLSPADSALIGRILLAEDRRDPAERSLAAGARHDDPRVRLLAQRALGRIRDPRFAARDSLPQLAAPPSWPEPAWRLRYRALALQKDDCAALRAALADSAWPVRLRVADVATPACAADDSLVAVFRGWVESVPTGAASRSEGSVSWHAAAHGAVALARLRPAESRALVRRLAAHPQWQLRAYAARAAALVADTTTLRALARDSNDNVKEVAIDSLARQTGHADDDLFLAALDARGAQAVRAAARALKGSPRADAPAAASRAFERWVALKNASARDARIALLEAAGRPASDDRPPPIAPMLPDDAVRLALGAERKLRVTMAPTSGGGSFTVRLRGDVAPIMAARILALARARYYDGLTWQRVESDFVIQGGSPDANEYVGSPHYLRDELGTLPHARGTVGMSTRGHDTGDAQWFVNLRDNLRLGRDYTVFGEVVEGIEVVDGVLEGDVILRIEEICGDAGPRGRD